jgi:DNA-binding transcriptional ArsR family regulator
LEDNKNYQKLAETLKAFAHPVRLCIISGLLEKGRCNVSNMERCLEISQSGISQHLSKLKMAGIITSEKVKNEVYYRLKNDDIKKFAFSILGGNIHD